MVLLTAEHGSATIGPMLRLGVANYIHKPFNPRELRGRIVSIMGDDEEEVETGAVKPLNEQPARKEPVLHESRATGP